MARLTSCLRQKSSIGRVWRIVVALAAGGRAVAAHAEDRLASPPELLELTGTELPALLGADPTAIEARAVGPDGLRTVHVQVDERLRDSDGALRYALDAGPEPRADPDPRFDADDVLLLWLPDGGPRLAEPARAGLTEVEARPETGGSRWFYLTRQGTGVRPSPLVRYDPAADLIAGDGYRLGFGRGSDSVIDRLALGDRTENLLDRSKGRFRASLRVGGTVERTEVDVVARATGLRLGPLRILREDEARARLLWGFYTPPVRDYFVFTPHAFLVPATVWIARAVRLVIGEAQLRISMDLADPARGMRFQSSVAPGVEDVVDGDGAPPALTRAVAPIAWYLLHDRTIGLLGWFTVDPPEYARQVTLYYRDDQSHLDPPESVPGELGDHGFLFRAPHLPAAGTIRITTYGAILRGDDLEQPAVVRERFAHPPHAVVRTNDR